MLSKAGVVLTEEEVVLAALSGLPEAYDAVVNTLESSTLEFSVAVPKLISAEQRLLRRRGTEHQAVAFTAGRYAPRCFLCGKSGHYQRQCKLRPKHAHASIASVSDRPVVIL